MNYKKLEEIISYKCSIFDITAAPDSAVSFTYYINKSTTMKHLLIPILLFSLILTSCDKGFDYDCTDCTFFVCDVNGKEYQPQCSGTIGFGCSARDARYYNFGSRDIYIYIYNEARDENIKIQSKNIGHENDHYPLYIKEDDIDWQTTIYSGPTGCIKHTIDPDSTTDRLYITEIDTINFIIAGEFNFTAYNECTNIPIEITNGKFRLSYTF